MAFNAPEWAIAYMGTVCYNCVISGVYLTDGPDACLYLAEYSEAEVIVVDSLQQFNKYAFD